MSTNEKFSELEQFENGTSSDKVIVIKSIYKSGKHTVQPAVNPATGWYAGVERLSDEEKKSSKLLCYSRRKRGKFSFKYKIKIT